MIDWANQNKGTYHMEPMRKVKASKPPEGCKNVRDQLQVKFG